MAEVTKIIASSPHYIIDLGGRKFLNIGDQGVVPIDKIIGIAYLKADKGVIAMLSVKDIEGQLKIEGVTEFRDFLAVLEVK